MRAPAALLLSLSFVLAASVRPDAVAAQPVLNRCIAADGTPVFTDRACELLDARPTTAANTDASTGTRGEGAAATGPLPDCARRPEALREAVEAALAAADGNRLAAYYDWRGRSSGAARVVMPRLEAIARSQPVAVRLYHSAERSEDPLLAAEALAAPPDRLAIEHAPQGGGFAEVEEFRLVRAAGCWWFAD